MKKVIRLTESELVNLVEKVVKEELSGSTESSTGKTQNVAKTAVASKASPNPKVSTMDKRPMKESDLIRIVKRVINEDGGGIPKNHPVNNDLYIQMKQDIEGEGVETIEFVPNQKLVIDAFGNKYTITKGKF